MKKSCQHIGLKVFVWLLVTIGVALGPISGPACAQSVADTFLAALPVSLGGLEQYIGPLLPTESIGNTFRSETGLAIIGAYPRYAMLRGKDVRELDLRDAMPMDGYPLRHDLYTNLRIWRLGLKAIYSDFDALNKQRNRGSFDFSGLTVGCDVDLVYQPWFQAGVGAEYHFYEPSLNTSIWNVPESQRFDINIQGKRPITAGAYARYIPPEILGFPVHGEAYFKFPVQGTKITSLGGALVFRPQIYRFDLGARLSLERTWLSFNGECPVANSADDWRLDTEWDFYGIQWLIYF